MVTAEFARVMARYNRWQNRSIVAAAETLPDAERRRDRGAFFASIAATLNHVLWDDAVWIARLAGDEATATRIGRGHPYTDALPDWNDYARERTALDERIVGWADALHDGDMNRVIEWTRGDVPMRGTLGFHLAHMVNHQTHHRGQVHAMLTAAGARPEATDLPVLPDSGTEAA